MEQRRETYEILAPRPPWCRAIRTETPPPGRLMASMALWCQRIGVPQYPVEKAAGQFIGELIPDYPAVPLGRHRSAGPQQPERLGDCGVVHGHGQVSDADRPGPVNAQQQGEPARVGQDLEPLGPGPDVAGLTDRTERLAD